MRLFKYILLSISGMLLVVLGYLAIFFPPVMTGMDAKIMCSCVFLAGRTPQSVMEKELKVFPGLTSAAFDINEVDSSVTATILWKKSKAIYRKGLGCTLLAERPESEVRGQRITIRGTPPFKQDSIAWPSGNLIPVETVPGVDYEAISAAMENAFRDADPEKPVHTHAVVVVYNGALVAERYAEGFDVNSPMMGWSMTKSVVNALMGILVKEGKLSLDQEAPVEEWASDERKQITINNLLQASTGLEWNEGYFVPTSHFHMMFTKSDDKAAYARSLPLEHEPGSFFEYSSGTTNILSGIIRQEVGDADYYAFPYTKLFYPIGMHNTTLELDASGTFVGSSYGYASARDWARFGLLYLNDGVWEGERILPEGWVRYSTTPAPAAPLQEYGAQIWLNAGKKNDASVMKYPGLPSDAFVFDGFEENSVVVIPSRNAVVVRLGVTHHGNFDLAGLVNGVLNGLPAPATARAIGK